MKNYRPAQKRAAVSVGESVRIIRELQGLSQNELAHRTGISQATISAIENDRVRLGVERAKVLALRSSVIQEFSCFQGGCYPRKRRHNTAMDAEAGRLLKHPGRSAPPVGAVRPSASILWRACLAGTGRRCR